MPLPDAALQPPQWTCTLPQAGACPAQAPLAASLSLWLTRGMAEPNKGNGGQWKVGPNREIIVRLLVQR
jgi:hypothetical protein